MKSYTVNTLGTHQTKGEQIQNKTGVLEKNEDLKKLKERNERGRRRG